MTLREIRHSVWLRRDRVGTLFQRGDYTRFVFSEEYLNDPDRPVLGLVFEQDLSARHAAALRLPCWFSNLLPELGASRWPESHSSSPCSRRATGSPCPPLE